MGTKDTILSAQDGQNWVRGVHDAAADGTPHLWKVGGRYTSGTGTKVASGDAVVLWIDPSGYITPHQDTVLLNSFTSASSSATGTTLGGLAAFKHMSILVDITAGAGTSPALEVYLDSRLDGTTYVNIAHLSYATATTHVVNLNKNIAAGAVIVGTDAGAGTIRTIPWGDDIRVRRDITGTSPLFDGRVWLISAVN